MSDPSRREALIARIKEVLEPFEAAGFHGGAGTPEAGWQGFAKQAWKLYDAAPELLREAIAALTLPQAPKEEEATRVDVTPPFVNGAGSPAQPCGCGETAWCEQHRPRIFGGRSGTLPHAPHEDKDEKKSSRAGS